MFESLIQSLDAIVWMAEKETLQFRFVNQQAERILGYPADHWLSEPHFWREHLHPDDAEFVLNACRELTADSAPLQLEYRMRSQDGRYLWLRDHISLHPDQPGLLQGIKFDLTAHKQIDENQQERTAVLHEFARLVSATLDHRQVLQQSLTHLKRVMSFESASIYLNPRDEQPEFVAGIGYEDEVMTSQEAQQLLKNSPILAQMAQDLQPVLSSDVRHLAGWIWIAGADHVRSFIAVPLVGYDQEMMGALMIDSKEVGFFTNADMQLVKALASHLAIAIENAWLYEAAQRQLAEKSALLAAGTAVSSSLDLSIILTKLSQAIGEALHVTSVYICDWNAYNQTTTVLAEYYSQAASAPERLSDLGKTYHVPSHFGSYKNWLTERRIVTEHVDDPTLTAYEKAHMKHYGGHSILYIPLVVRDEVIGYIELWESRQHRDFTPMELAISQGIAQHAAIALANAQLYAAEAQRRNEAEILKNLTINLTSTLELDEVFLRVIEAIRLHMPHAHNCGISLLENNGQTLRMRASWAERPEFQFATRGTVVAVADTAHSRTVLESRKPLAVADAWQEEPLSERGDHFRATGLRSILYAPLLIHNEPIGILHLNFWHEPRYFQLEEISFCQSVANQAAISIENARLFEKERRAAKELAILHELALATAVTLDIDSLLLQTTEKMVSNFYSYAFGFTLIDPESNRLRIHRSFHGLTAKAIESEVPTNSIAGHVFATGKPYISGDVRQDSLYFCHIPTTRSRIAVPLQIRGQIIGVINASSPEVDAFDEQDLRFLGTLASQVATAVERTRLYETLQEQADVLAKQVAERTAELQEEHDRTMAILESAGEGIVLTDTEGNIIYANPAMTRQSGYSHHELLQKTAAIWTSDQTPESVYRELWEALGNGRFWSGELVSQRQNGTYYDINLILSPIHDARENITSFVAVQSDISRLKEIERLKTKFVSNVSHELRTPLTNIKMYHTLLERGRVEKRDHYLHILNQETERLERLIQDLLDLSRLETAGAPDLTAVTNALANLDVLFTLYTNKAKKKSILFSKEIDTHLPPIQITEQHFEQLINNLLGNAIAYTPIEGFINLHAISNSQSAHIQITNSGPGIPASDLPHVFDRFYRGQAAQELAAPGTGLGLAICKEIVERYNGRIEIQSEPHHHTTITIFLPIAQTKIPES